MSIDNVIPLKRTFGATLSPTNSRTLSLVGRAARAVDGDLVQAFADLLAAALVASRFIELPEDQLIDHIRKFIPQADAAIAQRPDIFGAHANGR